MIDLTEYESGNKYDGHYDDDLKALQHRLSELQSLHILHNARTLVVVEGWDAAGKGGAIKRMTATLDPRYYRVFPISAPTDEEKDKHFLWRFWSKLPGKQQMSIWDRSHYGRVLVERVEGYCSEGEWRRGYDEINEFESRQGEIGTKFIKLFLHITQDTQDKVLTERLNNPSKRWKLTPDDFRNREKRGEYLDAMQDMFKRTDTRWAPWTVIDGNNQKSARIAVLKHVVKELESSLPQAFPEADPAIVAMAKESLGYSN